MSFENPFSLYHTMSTASNNGKLNFLKNIVGKVAKSWLPAFSSFPTMFSKQILSFLVTFHLVSTNASKKDQYKDSTLSQTTIFKTLPN